METIEVISADKATVVIQVNPQADQDSTIFVDGQEVRGTGHNAALKVFFKNQPKALGTVQIMIGVVIFFLGILLTVNSHSTIVVFSGITYWGSFIVKASLGMNVISAITAGFAILLMSIQLIVLVDRLYPEALQALRIIVILLVFTIPQFIISICISGFACKATCNRNSTVVNVTLN